MPILFTIVSRCFTGEKRRARTWVFALAIRASVVARHSPDQVLQSSLIPRLMALAQCRRHVERRATRMLMIVDGGRATNPEDN